MYDMFAGVNLEYAPGASIRLIMDCGRGGNGTSSTNTYRTNHDTAGSVTTIRLRRIYNNIIQSNWFPQRASAEKTIVCVLVI